MTEFFVHELTHHLLFLDEWSHSHYDYDLIMDKNTWCHSAILNRNRPLDKVIHSLAVASEIVLLRRNLLGDPESPKVHPPTKNIISSIKQSISSVRKLEGSEKFVYPRVWEILSKIEEKVLLNA